MAINKFVKVKVNMIFVNNRFDTGSINFILKVLRVEENGNKAMNHGEVGSEFVKVRV